MKNFLKEYFINFIIMFLLVALAGASFYWGYSYNNDDEGMSFVHTECYRNSDLSSGMAEVSHERALMESGGFNVGEIKIELDSPRCKKTSEFRIYFPFDLKENEEI